MTRRLSATNNRWKCFQYQLAIVSIERHRTQLVGELIVINSGVSVNICTAIINEQSVFGANTARDL